MKHGKAFRKLSRKIERDLNKLGITKFETEITKEHRSLFKKIFTDGYGDTQETLIIYSGFNEYAFNIYVPMAKGSVPPPYLIEFTIPVPMKGLAEYRYSPLKNKWVTHPKDKSRVKDLKSTIPKPKMKQTQVSKKAPMAFKYRVDIGHSLSGNEDGTTTWLVTSGYEGGMFSGGNRPKINKYITSLPKVRKMLETWIERE